MTILEAMKTNKKFKLPRHEEFGNVIDTNSNILFVYPVINGTISERISLDDLQSVEWEVNE